MNDVVRVGTNLNMLANHFVEDYWEIDPRSSSCKVTGLLSKETEHSNKFLSRLKEATEWLAGRGDNITMALYCKDDDGPKFLYRIKQRVHMFRHCMKKDYGYPDYTLRNGTVVAVWAETGDYILSVQPAVGDKVAKFLMECPDSPYAIEIAEEIKKSWKIAFPQEEHWIHQNLD